MLTKLEKDFPNMRLRLMGLRCTSLISTQKADVDFFGVKKRKPAQNYHKVQTDQNGWEAWPETEFEAAAKQEHENEMEELEQLSQEFAMKADYTPKEEFWDCPICQKPQQANDKALNEHIDACLSKRTITEIVHEARTSPPLKNESATVVTKKRGRPKHVVSDAERNIRHKPFFSH